MNKLIIVFASTLTLLACESKFKIHEKAPVFVESPAEIKSDLLDTTKSKNYNAVKKEELRKQVKSLHEAGNGGLNNNK